MWDEKFANAHTLSVGEKDGFTIEGMKPETCKSECLFLKNADGQDVYSGVRETCELLVLIELC